MLIDTGADVTLIPQSVAQKLALEPVLDTQYELLGFAGGINTAYAVKLEMIFLGRTFRGQFLLTDEEMGIIGRNVLNGIRLIFDGPKLSWDIAK
jgi:predicted aspartyl protease